jgi:hypothetical protein
LVNDGGHGEREVGVECGRRWVVETRVRKRSVIDRG